MRPIEAFAGLLTAIRPRAVLPADASFVVFADAGVRLLEPDAHGRGTVGIGVGQPVAAADELLDGLIALWARLAQTKTAAETGRAELGLRTVGVGRAGLVEPASVSATRSKRRKREHQSTERGAVHRAQR